MTTQPMVPETSPRMSGADESGAWARSGGAAPRSNDAATRTVRRFMPRKAQSAARPAHGRLPLRGLAKDRANRRQVLLLVGGEVAMPGQVDVFQQLLEALAGLFAGGDLRPQIVEECA